MRRRSVKGKVILSDILSKYVKKMFLILSDLHGQGQVHLELEKEKIGLPAGKMCHDKRRRLI